MCADPRVTDDHIVSLGFGEMGAGFGVFSEVVTKQAYTQTVVPIIHRIIRIRPVSGTIEGGRFRPQLLGIHI